MAPTGPANALRFHLVDELLAEDSVAVAEEVARCTVPREGVAQLLRGPLCGRMCLRERYSSVQKTDGIFDCDFSNRRA